MSILLRILRTCSGSIRCEDRSESLRSLLGWAEALETGFQWKRLWFQFQHSLSRNISVNSFFPWPRQIVIPMARISPGTWKNTWVPNPAAALVPAGLSFHFPTQTWGFQLFLHLTGTHLYNGQRRGNFKQPVTAYAVFWNILSSIKVKAFQRKVTLKTISWCTRACFSPSPGSFRLSPASLMTHLSTGVLVPHRLLLLGEAFRCWVFLQPPGSLLHKTHTCYLPLSSVKRQMQLPESGRLSIVCQADGWIDNMREAVWLHV